MGFEKIKLTDNYITAYDGLNEAQKKAVDTIFGPVAVMAGPGTGKTQIISARIGRILSTPETQAAPYNILCLTFTDAGAIAMRERLVKLIGPEAHKVPIFTYHAFCNQVIQQNPERFGLREWKPVSEIELIELSQELIATIKPGKQLYYTSNDRSFLAYGLRAFFELFKKENWKAGEIKQKIALHLLTFRDHEQFYFRRAYTKGDKKYMPGDFNEDKYEKLFAEEQRKMKRLEEAMELYPVYNELLAARQRFDYQDMIRWVIDAFANDEALLLRYKEQYLYFLVDEFQDSNGSQIQLLEFLTSDPDGQPNIFVVGDPDQAIYRFQGADAENIDKLKKDYEAHMVDIDLKDNYRSSANILLAAAALISHNHEGKPTPLNASNPGYARSPDKVQAQEYFNPAHESAGIASAIEALQKAGVSLNEIAVIYRNHAQASGLVQSLLTMGIPFRTARPVNILELPLVKQMLNMLRYVAEENRAQGYGEYLLFEMMHYDFIGIHPMDAARFSRVCYQGSEKRAIPWRELLASPERMFQYGLGSAARFSSLSVLLDKLMKAYANNTLQELFGELVHEGGILTWAMNQPDRTWWMEVINTLFDFIKEETSRNPKLTLSGLISLLDKMTEYQVTLNALKIFHAEVGVDLLTAHSAKGLEYSYVFLMGANAAQWEDRSARGGFFSLPPTIQRQGHEVQQEDERRLFYVAMTRAKKKLTISFSEQDMKGKKLEKSRFVDEMTASGVVEENRISLSHEEMMKYTTSLITPVELPSMPLIDKDLIRGVLKGYRLSVTHLNKYLRCPLAFYFENILRIPFARSANMGFGSAVHYALEMFYKDMQATKTNSFGSKESLIQYFEKSMNYYRSHFTDDSFAQYLERGRYVLENYLSERIPESNPIVLLEYRSNHLTIEGVPVSGMLDKIEFDGKKVTVVDYKTGKYEYAKDKLNPPDEKDPNGGDYWRQMIFYKILIDNDRSKDWEMTNGRFDFVEQTKEGALKQESISILPEYVRLVLQQTKETYQHIIDMNFEPGCGEKDCQWCNFAKSNYAQVNLAAEEE